MKNDNRNEEAVSPVIATILMVAITVVLAGVLYVWASSLADGNTDGDLTLISMSAEDAQGSPTQATDDALIRVQMNQGNAINWAALSVQVSVDNDAPVTCGMDNTSESNCWLKQFGPDITDQDWSVGEGVTIMENNAPLCDANSDCAIEVTITDTRAGKVLVVTTAIAS